MLVLPSAVGQARCRALDNPFAARSERERITALECCRIEADKFVDTPKRVVEIPGRPPQRDADSPSPVVARDEALDARGSQRSHLSLVVPHLEVNESPPLSFCSAHTAMTQACA